MQKNSPTFKHEGHISDLRRSIDKAVMQIETDSGKRQLGMPLKIKNDFELIPYQMALLNQKVKYEISTKTFERECGHVPYSIDEVYFKLSILTGPLKGKYYKTTECH